MRWHIKSRWFSMMTCKWCKHCSIRNANKLEQAANNYVDLLRSVLAFGMRNTVFCSARLGITLSQAMFFSIQLVQRWFGMDFNFATHTASGFRGDGVSNQTHISVINITCRSNGYAMGDRVEIGQRFKILLELHTSFLQQSHIPLTIGNQFFLKIKLVPFLPLRLVPRFKFLPSGVQHAFGIVIILGWNLTHVLLVFHRVKKWGKNPFFNSFISNAFVKPESCIYKKHMKSMNFNLSTLMLRILAPFTIWSGKSAWKFFQYEITIVCLKIVCHADHRLFPLHPSPPAQSGFSSIQKTLHSFISLEHKLFVVIMSLCT